jgi:hypothetical protein
VRTRLATLALAAAALFGSGGCMTMFAPPRQEVFVTADPPGATVRAGDRAIPAPATVLLDTRYDWEIEATAPGYLAQRAVVESHYSAGKIVGSILLNVVAWGWWTFGIGAVVGVAVDFSSGSLLELDPSRVDIYLAPVPDGPREEGPRGPPPPPAGSRPAPLPLPPAAGAPPAPPGAGEILSCPSCGRALGGGETYCPGCGRRLK